MRLRRFYHQDLILAYHPSFIFTRTKREKPSLFYFTFLIIRRIAKIDKSPEEFIFWKMELQTRRPFSLVHREKMCDLFEFEENFYTNGNFVSSEVSSVSSDDYSEISSGSLPICIAPTLGPPINSLRILDRRPLHSSPVPIIGQSIPIENHQPRRFSFPMENYPNMSRRNAISTSQSEQLELIGEQLTLLNRRNNRREVILTTALFMMIVLVYFVAITMMAHLAKKAENNN